MLTANKVDRDILHQYINICTENGVKVQKATLNNVHVEFNDETYKLLLKNMCEIGDIKEVLLVLDIMKQLAIPIDENVFNNLVLAHTISG